MTEPTSKSTYDVRRENLARLLEHPGAKTQLAVRLGVSQARVSHMLRDPALPNSRRITTDQARELEQIMDLPKGALDVDPAQPSPPHAGASAPMMAATVRQVLRAIAEEGATLDADTTADLVAAVCDLTRPGELVPLPTVRQLVRLARRAP